MVWSFLQGYLNCLRLDELHLPVWVQWAASEAMLIVEMMLFTFHGPTFL